MTLPGKGGSKRFCIEILHVVLLAAVLPDLRHDLAFVLATYFPGTVIDDVPALKSHSAFIKGHDFPPFGCKLCGDLLTASKDIDHEEYIGHQAVAVGPPSKCARPMERSGAFLALLLL